MAVLSAPSDIGTKDGWEVRMKMAAVKIWQGGAVGIIVGTGYATPLLIATTGMKFVGVAEETLDNSAGSPGDLWIRVRVRGLAAFTGSGLTVANIGANVYFVSGSDDNTVAAAVTAICAGELKAFDSNGVAWVSLNTAGAVTAVLSSATVNAVAAAGNSQATGGALVAGINIVSAADSTKGVSLPATPAAGTCVIVKSTVAGQTLPVYPDAAATINAIGSHAAITMAALTSAIFVASSTTQWYTIPLLPS